MTTKNTRLINGLDKINDMELMQLVLLESTPNNSPEVQHKCEIIEDDIVETLLPGDKLINRIKRLIARRCILSCKHPITKSCIKSNAAVKKEIIKHIQLHPYMIHPFSEFRKLWEIFMIIFTLSSLLIIPCFIAFQFNDPHKWIYIVIAIKSIFLFDIILFFFTGYFDPETRNIIFHRKVVCQKYIKHFMLDLLSAFPFELIFVTIPTLNDNDSMVYVSALNLLMILRIRNLVSYLQIFRKFYQISFQMYKIIEMSVIILIIIHWASCLELLFPLIGEKYSWARRPNQISWINSEALKRKNTAAKMYASCAKRAVIALTGSSHHLDVKTREDILLNSFLSVLGRVGIIYMLAQFSQLMTMFYSTKKKNIKSLHQLLEYMRYKKLPRHVQQRILIYFHYWSNKSSKRDKMIISSVSSNLKEELLMHKYSKLIKNVEFFKHLPDHAISQVIMYLKAEIYLTDDVLVEADSICDTMFYIICGTVAVYTKSKRRVCYLEEDSYFGEIGLVLQNEKRPTTIIAMETCEVYLLHRDDFLKIIESYPYLINRLQKLIIGKLEKFSSSQTFHKFDEPQLTNIDVYDESSEVRNI
ncbi:potassium/sodium hyperpolarization-activated cyclic nucleotide-gated channel 4-like [Chelonus insularis]|uniref:potassium/sodium hyperpolarization-activated cyclic nucleotide-gated channel 4-like n=1 Tax=Chelonus insularis TaxID=460826 RepID=UPI001588D6F7|nr:potassium/sodium hyperpolarization-activated cyclic nucleotide-gated channel 4-like [Chelonus insularis]